MRAVRIAPRQLSSVLHVKGAAMKVSGVQGAVWAALALCGGTASAAEVNVSGFGTAGIAFTDTDDAEFVRSSQPVGADSSGDVGVDSIAGIQATTRLTDRVSGTVQVLVRRLYDPGFELDVPMAFIKVDLNEGFAVRIGRVPAPLFLVSDFRQVGYANTWIRPPIEVYGQAPLDSVDGLDVLYTGAAGPVSLNGQAFYGKTDLDLSTSDASVRKFWGVNLNASIGPVTLRAGRAQSRLSLDSAPANSLLAGLRQAGFTALANELSPIDRESTFTAFGALLDWNNLIVQAEATKSTSDSFIPDTSGRYGLVGYRMGELTPFVIYAEREVDSARTSNVVPQVGPLIPLALGVNALIAGAQQDTTSVGVRWDAADSVAVKFQYDYIDPEGAGLLANASTGFNESVNVFSLAVDVVF
jgi:hypothetical protein